MPALIISRPQLSSIGVSSRQIITADAELFCAGLLTDISLIPDIIQTGYSHHVTTKTNGDSTTAHSKAISGWTDWIPLRKPVLIEHLAVFINTTTGILNAIAADVRIDKWLSSAVHSSVGVSSVCATMCVIWSNHNGCWSDAALVPSPQQCSAGLISTK